MVKLYLEYDYMDLIEFEFTDFFESSLQIDKAAIVLNHNIHATYKHFTDFFKLKGYLTKHDIIIGANFTYAWMPTMNKTGSDVNDTVITALNELKNNKMPLSKDEIHELSTLTNNSLVGVSKLLHFISPSEYAIWDSRVLRYLMSKNDRYPYGYLLNKIDYFFQYLDLMKRLSHDERSKDLTSRLSSYIGYEISAFRALELVMFEFGKAKK